MVAMIVLVRAKGADLETVNPQALEGVPDAMSVSNLTQASLLHTVRERYNRDEVSITLQRLYCCRSQSNNFCIAPTCFFVLRQDCQDCQLVCLL